MTMALLWIIKSPSCTIVEKPMSKKSQGLTVAPKQTVMTVLWWLVALLTVVTTEASSSITSSVTIASCRAACLHVFTSPNDARDVKCRKNSDCFMCWNSCGILRHQMGIWGSMCADHTACLPGCQVACGFYLSASREMGGVRPYMIPPPPPLPAYQPPPRISGRSQVVWGALDWSGSAAPPRDDVIYVLFINSGSGWREVVQTSSRSAHMPPGVSGIPRLRLLAVSQEGIVAASDTLLHTNPTHHGSVEYKVEDIRPDAVETVPERATISNLPDHTYIPTLEASESQHSEFYPYDHTVFESQKVALGENANPAAPSAVVDPTWSLQVVSVESDIMAEVKVVWEPRGSDGVEYLLSWMEETGGVSGHLLTDQLTTDLSLWPGQGYYLQVELVDSQGNAVMKSLPTPVLFKTTTTSTSVTVMDSPSTVTIQQNLTPDHTVSLRNPTASIQDDSYRAIWLNNGTLIGRDGTLIGRETPLGTTRTYESIQDNTDNIENPVDELAPTYSENGHTKSTTQKDSELRGTVSNDEDSDQRSYPPTRGEGSSTGVSAREIPAIMASDRADEEVLWYVGVSIGVLLILIICSLVVWSLGRCRKVPRNEEYIEDRLNGIRESFREDVIRRSRSNPQTSWTFEKCCSSSGGHPRMGEPQRKENVPAGIDNASLVENYVLMLDSRPPKKKPRH